MEDKGKFIVVEGIEGGGKTSAIKRAIEISDQDFFYSSGFPIDSKWDRFVHSHADSTLYYLYFGIKSRDLRSQLSSGKTVIQDKYVQAVDSFLPDCQWSRNKIARVVFNPLFINPDLYVYFDLTTDESIRRIGLKSGEEHRSYYQYLLQHPEVINERRKAYERVFNDMRHPKVKVDVTNKTVEESAQIILEEIANVS
ncbi:MAG: hypothetical protein ABIB79_04260 [archaeon]